MMIKRGTFALHLDIKCPEGHRLERRNPPQVGWSCDGDEGPEDGCLKPDDNTYDHYRYRCGDCDYDLCWQCYDSKANKAVNQGTQSFLLFFTSPFQSHPPWSPTFGGPFGPPFSIVFAMFLVSKIFFSKHTYLLYSMSRD